MNNHSTLVSLVKKAQAGNADAGEALAYAFTGMIGASMAGIDLGFHTCQEANDYRRLSWYNGSGNETIRVALVGGGKISFQTIDRKGNMCINTHFPNIGTMIRVLRLVEKDTKTAPNPTKRRGSAQRSRLRAKQ